MLFVHLLKSKLHLFGFVVDLQYNLLYGRLWNKNRTSRKSTTNPQQVVQPAVVW